MLEGAYKTKLRKRIEAMFPGCIILKNDAGYLQGVPDMIILFRTKWATLETKRKYPRPGSSDFEPNQEYYIELMDHMSFSRAIYPENEDEVLSELQQAFLPRRQARLPKR